MLRENLNSPDCLLVQCARAVENWTNLWTCYCIGHTPHWEANSSYLNSAMFLLSLSGKSITRLCQRTDLASRFIPGSVLASLSKHTVFGAVCLSCLSMATLICAYGTMIVTSHEPSKLVAERTFCALRDDKDYIREWLSKKIFFIVYSVASDVQGMMWGEPELSCCRWADQKNHRWSKADHDISLKFLIIIMP